MSEQQRATPALTPEQQLLNDPWGEHARDEFVTCGTEATLETMAPDACVNHEHIYWDQASVLVQLGLLDPTSLPVVGRESAEKAVHPSLPSNGLMSRLGRGGP